MIEIYTDGSCVKNPNGPGGWAFCIIDDNIDFIMSDGDSCTTNNRMELTAIIEALSSIKSGSECTIYTDSQLCINCAIGKWKRKANLDLWEKYDILSQNKIIHFEWVKGHSGNKYNELVDNLALKEAKNIKCIF
jgi:ribonuclease HI